jgi:hypothetical protein
MPPLYIAKFAAQLHAHEYEAAMRTEAKGGEVDTTRRASTAVNGDVGPKGQQIDGSSLEPVSGIKGADLSRLDYGLATQINPTPELLVTAPADSLRTLFAEGVRDAVATDLRYREEGRTNTRRATLDKVLAKRMANIDTLMLEDVRVAFTFFEGYTQDNPRQDIVSAARAALMMEDSPPSHDAIVNQWLKYVYFRLWNHGAVQFPLHFNVGTSFSKEELKLFLPPIVTCHLDHKQREMASFGFRLTLATCWHDFADVDLDSFGAFSLECGRSEVKREQLGMRRKNHYTPFTATLWTWCRYGAAKGFRYSEEDVRDYLYWIERARCGATSLIPSDFMPHAQDRKIQTKKNIRAKYQRRRASAQVDLLDHDNRDDVKKQILKGEKSLFEVKLELAATRVNDPSEILEYIKMLRIKGFGRKSRIPYPLRMHSFPVETWNTWNSVFEEYFERKRRSGYEETAEWNTFRYVFQDYLCCYLPWWLELHPGIDLVIPADPSHFGRYGAWTDGPEDEAAPLPLLRLFDQVRLGSSNDSFNAFIRDAHSFFEYCRGQALMLRLRRQDFQNPVNKEVDRVITRQPSKTNKAPIPSAVLPYLLRYAYAVEGFFLTITERSLGIGLSKDEQRRVSQARREGVGYNPSEWGIEVGFEYQGTYYVIDSVPAVATWDYRSVRSADGPPRRVRLPQLSGFRMTIVALETGIRFQGVQWLCQATFNSLNGPHLATAELIPLIVNTDKVRDEPWKTLIVRRAHDVLLREAAFQALMTEADVERRVPYERRDHTRFAPILPLFRAASSDYPVGDRAYAMAWERLIIGFGHWYGRAMPDAEPLRMWRFEPVIDQITGAPREEMYLDDDGSRPCCPINLRLKHTPHSARSTFITSRAGILPIEMTGWLVGQTNKATTEHYTIETELETGAKVLAASNSLWSPDPANPIHIRADMVDSALRKSFEVDRLKTERAFGFHTLSLLNEDLPDLRGIALLRSTAMSRIAFRETHICPVGEICPTDVLEIIVEPRRCGICPLAVKCVDHVTAIAAKRRQLLEQVDEANTVLGIMRQRGEPDSTMNEVQHRRRLDVMEEEGWRTTFLTLEQLREDLQHAAKEVFIAGMPDVVRLHLRLVTVDYEAAAFILHRIVDSYAHTAFETPRTRAQAARLRQRLLSSSEALNGEISMLENDPVKAFVASLSVALKARGIEPTFRAALERVRSELALPFTASSNSGLLRDTSEG